MTPPIRGPGDARGERDRRRAEIAAQLATGARGEEGFRHLVEEYYGSVLEFFRRKRFSPEDCEDLAQDTFVNVYRGFHTFRSDASLTTWIRSVASNVWLNELRRRTTGKRRAREISVDDPEAGSEREAALRSEGERLVEELLKRERRQLVLAKLRDLPPRMRHCMLLRVIQDLHYHEIAAVMRISIQTVRSQLHEARRRLDETMDEVKLHD